MEEEGSMMFRGSVVSKDHPFLGKCRLRDPCVCREAKHLWQCPEARTNDRNVLQAGGFVIWSLRRRESWACCFSRGWLQGVGGTR